MANRNIGGVLRGSELKEVFETEMVDIRLCVYLDPEKRIVRISTLPGESLVTDTGEGEMALNLTGWEATIDRLEGEYSYIEDGVQIFDGVSGALKAEGNFIIEKDAEERRVYSIEHNLALRYGENMLGLSLESSVQGERLEEGEKLSVDLAKLIVESEDKVICRMSGRATFEPLGETITLPKEREYRIGEMGDAETMLFLAECVENAYKNT